MTDWRLRDECKCGHERDSHHERTHNCLAIHCDCVRFRKPGEPEPAAKRYEPPQHVDDGWDDDPWTVGSSKPHANTSCRCAACQAWVIKKMRGIK